MTEPPNGLERLTAAIHNLFNKPSTPSLPDCSKQKQEFIECMESVPTSNTELKKCKELFTQYRNCVFPERNQ